MLVSTTLGCGNSSPNQTSNTTNNVITTLPNSVEVNSNGNYQYFYQDYQNLTYSIDYLSYQTIIGEADESFTIALAESCHAPTNRRYYAHLTTPSIDLDFDWEAIGYEEAESYNIYNEGIIFDYPESEKIILFSGCSISSDSVLKDIPYENFKNWLPFNFAHIDVLETNDFEYFVDEKDASFRITYSLELGLKLSEDDTSIEYQGYRGYFTCYEDYNTMTRYYALCASTKFDASRCLKFLDGVRFGNPNIDYRNELEGTYTFPDGMNGYTEKHPLIADSNMSTNITHFVDSNGNIIDFHWRGPSTVGLYATENNNVLELSDQDGNYYLRVSLVNDFKDFCYTNIDEDGNITYSADDTCSKYLYENEEFIKGSTIDYNISRGNRGLAIAFPISRDDGYKGYAYMCEGNSTGDGKEHVYVFTYVEKEEVYDDARALEVINYIGTHQEKDN